VVSSLPTLSSSLCVYTPVLLECGIAVNPDQRIFQLWHPRFSVSSKVLPTNPKPGDENKNLLSNMLPSGCETLAALLLALWKAGWGKQIQWLNLPLESMPNFTSDLWGKYLTGSYFKQKGQADLTLARVSARVLTILMQEIQLYKCQTGRMARLKQLVVLTSSFTWC